ncbi:intraflagellar transport-associated protein isoform X2 [Hypomesus transpacificus]|uniref:intraflagellar transport-associated protein isoform X2 n=1 Tax=Hypomesus transpacificus TaxID=137520 RepID=UPI001F086EB0|nr:intraflagellar transport-associated protein isoform X2 [Hypomesus transpacificus]
MKKRQPKMHCSHSLLSVSFSLTLSLLNSVQVCGSMLGVDSGSSALASDDQMVAKALEHFCSASEQSYHQFLASFTHLSPGSGSGAASSGLPQHPAEMERSARSSRGRGGHGAADAADAADAAEGEGRLRERDCVLPVDQKEMELGRGVVVGICGHIDCCPPGTTPKLDNYLAFGDACEDMEGEDNITPGDALLPGEVEEEVPAYLPSFCHHTQLELTSMVGGWRAQARGPAQEQKATPEEQGKSEEVSPFSLDEDFDYDHVILSCKHSSIKTSAGAL